MGPLRAWCLYLGLVLGVGALIAPWCYAAAQSLAAHWPAAAWLAAHPFRRYLSRCLLVGALAGLPLLWRRLHLRRTTSLGWSHPAGGRRELMIAWGLGTAGTVALLCFSVGAGWRWSEPLELERRLGIALGAFASGAAVAVLEETLFRGALYSSLRRHHGPWLSGTFTTGLFVLSHYFARAHQEGAVGWLSGFEVLGRSLQTVVSVGALPETTLLAAAGAVLVWVRERSGALWWPAGLHAGWVFGRKLADGLTELQPTAGFLEEWRGSLLMLAVTAVALVWLVPKARPEPIDGNCPPTVG